MADLGDWAECTLCKSAYDTRLGEVFNIPKGCAAIQSDMDVLEKWADRNLMEFNKKCKILYLGKNSLRHQDTIEGQQEALQKRPWVFWLTPS